MANHAAVVELTKELNVVGAKTSIFHDFFGCCLHKAADAGFSVEQTAAFVAITRMIITHAFKVGGPVATIEDSYSCFKDLVLTYGVSQQPGTPPLFAVDDIKAITSFFSDTFFRHFKLYSFVLGPGKRRGETRQSLLPAETPVFLASLEHATLVVADEPVGDDSGDGAAPDAAPCATPDDEAVDSAPEVSDAFLPVVDYRVFSSLSSSRSAVEANKAAREEELAALRARLAE